MAPFLKTGPPGPKLAEYLKTIDLTPRRSMDFLVAINQRLQGEIGYLIRMEPGVHSSEETLTLKTGSCRDSAWLEVEIFRQSGVGGALRLRLSDPVEARRQTAGRSGGRRLAGFHGSARLDRSVFAGRGLDRAGPDLGSAGRRRTHSALGDA